MGNMDVAVAHTAEEEERERVTARCQYGRDVAAGEKLEPDLPGVVVCVGTFSTEGRSADFVCSAESSAVFMAGRRVTKRQGRFCG